MMPYRDRLSGTDANGSSIDGITTYPTLTTIHTVPPLETHTIWLLITNTNAADLEILGDVGEEADSFNHVALGESTEVHGPITLVGGSTGTSLTLAAISNPTNIKVCGSVERYRSDR